ncbi:MAG: hypothetical protein PHW63_05730 [Alphaproteobacteria bacterium]|nr:hypothetical protein [Alphaproteobacteria bacterium]
MLLGVPQKPDNEARRALKEKPYWLLSFLFFLAIILVPFQNTALSQTPLRYLGASLSFVPITFFCLFSFLSRLLNRRIGSPEKWLAGLLLYSVVASVWGLIAIDAGAIKTSFLAVKFLTNTALNILLIYPIFVAPTPNKTFRRAISLSFFLAVIGYVLIDVLSIPFFGAPSFLKITWGTTFPSGFSLEQSTFAATVCLLSLISAVLAQRRITRWFYISIALVFVTILSASKGTTLCLVLAFGFSFLFSGRKGKGGFTLKLLGLCFAAFLSFFVYDQMAERFQSDLDSSSSSSTRSILILTSIPSVIENPLGVGYANYIPAIMVYTQPVTKWVRENLISNATTRELESYFAQEDKMALNIKAQFFEYLMVFGIPGLFLLIKFHLYLYKRIVCIHESNRETYLLLFWFVVFSLSSYISALGLYLYTVAYAVLLKGPSLYAQESNKNHKSTPM